MTGRYSIPQPLGRQDGPKYQSAQAKRWWFGGSGGGGLCKALCLRPQYSDNVLHVFMVVNAE